MNKHILLWLNSGNSWSPSQISNILTWWDNGSTYMAADGSQWTDRVGGKNLTAAGGARPTFTASAQNNLPSFTFNGTTNVLAGSRITEIQNKSAITIWSVGKRFSFTQDNGLASSIYRTNLLHFSDNAIYGSLTNGSQPHFGSYAFSNSFAYVVMVYNGSLGTNADKLKIYVNGIQQTLSFTGTIPSTTENQATTPRMGNFSNVFIAGQMCETGIITSAITSDDLTLLNSYLSSKYAL